MNELQHAFKWEKKNHKYVARVKMKNDKYRYFYTMAAYKAYMRFNKNAEGEVIGKDSSLKKQTNEKKKFDFKSLKKKTLDLKKLTSNGKNFVGKVQNKILPVVKKSYNSNKAAATGESIVKKLGSAVNKTLSSVPQSTKKLGEIISTTYANFSVPKIKKSFTSTRTTQTYNRIDSYQSFADNGVYESQTSTRIEKTTIKLTAFGALLGAATYLFKGGIKTAITAYQLLREIEVVDERELGRVTLSATYTELSPDEKAEKAVDGERFTGNDGRVYEKHGEDVIPVKDESRTWAENEDMRSVNPNYNPSDPIYSNNCADCSLAYDLRRRGLDVTAAGNDQYGTEYDDVHDWYKDEVIHDGYTADQASVYSENILRINDSEIEAIRKEMIECGEGAYGILNVQWCLWGGHSIVWSIENGEVVIRDSQINESSRLEDTLTLADRAEWFQTNNLELEDIAYKYVSYVDQYGYRHNAIAPH